MLAGSEDRVPEWNAAGQWETAVSEPDLLRNRNKSERDPVAFGTTLVRSDAFKIVFREGMELIEDTAAYLDGPGRDESRRLPRQAALAYASESMRLTTRLMQIASWLLVQRAVAQGEITPNSSRPRTAPGSPHEAGGRNPALRIRPLAGAP